MEEIKKKNLEVLHSHGYGIEERGSVIDLYNDNTFLFVQTLNSHHELAEWIKKNIK